MVCVMFKTLCQNVIINPKYFVFVVACQHFKFYHPFNMRQFSCSDKTLLLIQIQYIPFQNNFHCTCVFSCLYNLNWHICCITLKQGTYWNSDSKSIAVLSILGVSKSTVNAYTMITCWKMKPVLFNLQSLKKRITLQYIANYRYEIGELFHNSTYILVFYIIVLNTFTQI